MNLKFLFMGIYAFVMLFIGVFMMLILRDKIYILRKIWALTVIKLLGIEIEEQGTLDINADILILNHNSVLDGILLDYLHPKEISWVAKDMLSKLPIFGYILKLPKLILIDPSKRSSMRKLLDEVKKAHQAERPVGIFPEGRHGKTGAVGRFKKGIKTVAEQLDLKVQPIVMTNTKRIFNTETYQAFSGTVNIVYLDTVDVSDASWFEDLESKIKKVYAEMEKSQ